MHRPADAAAESVVPSFLTAFTPAEIPGLIAFWHFGAGGERFPAAQGEPYALRSAVGPLAVVDDPDAPLGGRALELAEGQWLRIPRAECPALDIHGPGGRLTLVAWIRRGRTQKDHCEFVAGQWNETNRGRQYGLFLNIRVWQRPHRICGHLSHVGGPTPGYRYCIDGAMGDTEIPWDEWHCVAMSYDGVCGYAWLDGRLDARPGLNPYPMAGGLHDGGPNGSDFTVGAVDRSGAMGNFFRGRLAGLAVWRRALTPAELFALARGPVAAGRGGPA